MRLLYNLRPSRALRRHELQLVLRRLADLCPPELGDQVLEQLAGDGAVLAALLGELEGDVIEIFRLERSLAAQALGERERRRPEAAQDVDGAVVAARRGGERAFV